MSSITDKATRIRKYTEAHPELISDCDQQIIEALVDANEDNSELTSKLIQEIYFFGREAASRDLRDDLADLRTFLERARLLLNEITDYFESYDTSDERGRFAVSYGYPNNGIKANIVSDYLWRMHGILSCSVNKANMTLHTT